MERRASACRKRTRAVRRFSLALRSASQTADSSLSQPTALEPKRAQARARIPEPQPRSKTSGFFLGARERKCVKYRRHR